MSGFSQAYGTKTLEAITGKASLTKPTAYLALCTAVPTASSTGSTITEATYTGYARKEIPAAEWNAAVAGVPSTIANKSKLEFAACTGGTSTIIGWALCDSSGTGTGNVVCWGTASSTIISLTQTPATVAAEVLVISLQ